MTPQRTYWLGLVLGLCLTPLAAVAQVDDAQTQDDDTGAQVADSPPPVEPDPERPPSRALPPGEEPCLQPHDGDDAPPLAFAIQGRPQRIDRVQLTGLTTLTEEKLWPLVLRSPPGSLSVEQAQRLVARFHDTGLFQEVKPTVRVDSSVVLEIALTEYPTVTRVGFRGLTELRAEDLVEDLFETADGTGWRAPDRCTEPLPPDALLAREEHHAFYSGIAWQGLAPGLNRVLRHVRAQGYVLASLEATLSPGGELVIDVDEGHLDKVVIDGVPRELEPKVRRELGLEPGRVFLADELERAVARVEARYPFLTAEVHSPAGLTEEVHVEGTRAADGSWRFSTEPGREEDAGRPSDDDRLGRRRSKIIFGTDGKDLFVGHHRWSWGHDHGGAKVHGKDVEVEFESNRTDLKNDWSELFHHTQVTGFAPGVMLSGWLWDPADRFHFGIDAGLNLNTGRSDRVIDWAIGPRLQLPALKLAELGVQFHAITDTEDRWRVSRFDSYFHSILFGRPESEYFRRTGLWAFATWHLAEKWTVGGEYRRDTYESLAPLASVWTLFPRASGIPPNPAITDGQIGSVVIRLEYSTQKTQLRAVGDPWRAVTRSIVERPFYAELHSGLTTVNTVEISTAGLGSGPDLSFIKFVSDTAVHFATGHDRGLRVRLRAAGGERLPLQKQEALGGWGSLRGFGFKEFRGDYSLLGSAEYQLGFVSAFADLGSVKQPGGWIVPRLGLGAQLNFGEVVSFAAAWRTDDRARIEPELRLTIGRSF